MGGKLVLITNRKSYMSFPLVPKSVTLNDLERRSDPYFVGFLNFLEGFSNDSTVCWSLLIVGPALPVSRKSHFFTQMFYYCFFRVQPVAAWFLQFCWPETHIHAAVDSKSRN